jgi:hypothetical protein
MVATLVYDSMFLLVVQVSGLRVDWGESLLRVMVPSAILNTLCAPLVLGGMMLLYRRFRREEVGI